MPRRRSLLPVSLALVAGVAVTVALAGPLNPPPGPVAPTDPDLGQILGAVNATASTSCATPIVPGTDASATLTVVGTPTTPILEFNVGRTAPPGGFANPAGSSERDLIEIVRLPDADSPIYEQAALTQPIIASAVIEATSGATTYTYDLSQIRFLEFSIELVQTCDGPRFAERLTIEVLGGQSLTVTP
jgi:hypothetical protein